MLQKLDKNLIRWISNEFGIEPDSFHLVWKRASRYCSSDSYQRQLKEHNIIQSMSRKGNCMDNGAMENSFGRLKVEMFYGEMFDVILPPLARVEDGMRFLRKLLK